MKPIRLCGDPFGQGAAAAALRSCLEQANARGFLVSLCLTAARPGGEGERTIELGDGARTFAVRTDLPPATLERLQAAAATPVPATAPVVVFAPRRTAADQLALAGLEWPRACAVLDGAADSADAVLDRVAAELRWAGTEMPEVAGAEAVLQAFCRLPPPPADGPVLHVASGDPYAGSDVAVRAFLRALPAGDRCLRILLPAGRETAVADLSTLALELGGPAALARLSFATGALQPAHAADCSAILQPLRRLPANDVLPCLLASGRPVVATRFSATAVALSAPGTCMPVGGTLLRADDGLPFCEPDLDNVVTGLQQALADHGEATQMGRRARHHALVELSALRPAAPPSRPAQPRQRPTVVLEAPFFEVSSAAELSIETARALLARDLVDLRLVATTPFRGDLETLRRRAPELEAKLVRAPSGADLWLSSGWPPRTVRPRCATFAVRLDWEYGALPTELLPLVTQEADLVVVHSRHVERTVVAAGCPRERVHRVPHGVDAALFHDGAAADAAITAWKGDRPAVLFVGGLVFRKGFDVLLRMALAAGRAGARFVLVVKALGHDQHYAGYHFGELARRFQATAGAPPLLLLDGELERQRLPAIYRACDLLCHPYRGEGFGLPVLEARASGLPVLITRGGATDDFAGGGGAVTLPATRRAVALRGAHQGQPWLLEPDAEAAGSALTAALRDLPALTAAARAQAAAVRAAHTWEAAAAAIEQMAIGARAGTPATVLQPAPATALPGQPRATAAPRLSPDATPLPL